MSRHWKICAVAILITGSTSSTFGAIETLCTAAQPETAEAALRARPSQPSLPIAYREDIHHPAMTSPLVTRGTFDLGRGDTVLRMQTSPTQETTEIRTSFITVRRGDYENTVPIPSRMAPVLGVLREIITGDSDPAANAYALALSESDRGWTVSLTPKEEGVAAMALSGCGEVLREISFDLEGGERRVIVFAPE